MKELYEKVQAHIVTKLWDIVRECDDEGGIVSSQMLDDAKDCVGILAKLQVLSK